MSSPSTVASSPGPWGGEGLGDEATSTANDLFCRKRANARMNTPSEVEVHGTAAVLIVES